MNTKSAIFFYHLLHKLLSSQNPVSFSVTKHIAKVCLNKIVLDTTYAIPEIALKYSLIGLATVHTLLRSETKTWAYRMRKSLKTHSIARLEREQKTDEEFGARGLIKTWREHGNVNILTAFFKDVSDAEAVLEVEQFSGLLLEGM